MNDDEELGTFLLDNDPADLLPYSKRLIAEDTDAQQLPKAYIPNSHDLYPNDQLTRPSALRSATASSSSGNTDQKRPPAIQNEDRPITNFSERDFSVFCTAPFLTENKEGPNFSRWPDMRNESPMATILPFIRSETAFDDSTTRIMGLAFDAACAEFREADLTKLTREIIAAQIIQAAKRGERDPARLCRIAVSALRGGEKARQPAAEYAK
jgi:hypothetical protein